MTKYELAFRITLFYLALIRWVIVWLFPRGLRSVLDAEKSFIERASYAVARLLAAIPLALYVIHPASEFNFPGDFPDALRWGAIGPAVAAMVWIMWSLQVVSGPEEGIEQSLALRQLLHTGPYRFARHPVELGKCIFALSLALFSGQLFACVGVGLSVCLVFAVVMPLRSKRLRRLLDTGLAAKGNPRSSFALPKAQYQVPRRFGLAAILGIMTILCLLFGGLNLLRTETNISPAVDLFFAGQFLCICFGQMFFHRTPRAISAITGAILLPMVLVVSTLLENRHVDAFALAIGALLLSILGLLVGYCLGTVAAGFFLVADWIESRWTQNKSL